MSSADSRQKSCRRQSQGRRGRLWRQAEACFVFQISTVLLSASRQCAKPAGKVPSGLTVRPSTQARPTRPPEEETAIATPSASVSSSSSPLRSATAGSPRARFEAGASDMRLKWPIKRYKHTSGKQKLIAGIGRGPRFSGSPRGAHLLAACRGPPLSTGSLRGLKDGRLSQGASLFWITLCVILVLNASIQERLSLLEERQRGVACAAAAAGSDCPLQRPPHLTWTLS